MVQAAPPPIRIECDHENEVAYVYVREGREIAKTVEIHPEVWLDLDANGKLIGVEILKGDK